MHLRPATMRCMSAVKGRACRPGRGQTTKLLQGRVAPEAHEAAKTAADAEGLSIAAYIERLVLEDAKRRAAEPAAEKPYQERLAV